VKAGVGVLRPYRLPGLITDIGILDEFFVSPTASTSPAPYRSPNEPTRDRPPWDDDGPKMPRISPRRS